MDLLERITSIDSHRRLRDNVIRLDERREKREPQKWWEKAQAGQLVRKDFTGQGPDAA
jgi:hypothetical protein